MSDSLRARANALKRAVVAVGRYLEGTFDLEGMWRVYSEETLRRELESCASGHRSSTLGFGSELGPYSSPAQAPSSLAREPLSPASLPRVLPTRSLKDLLSSIDTPGEARSALVTYVPGLGLTRASRFLRNVQFSYDVAVIDSQALRFLSFVLGEQLPFRPSLTQRVYLALESDLRKFSTHYDIRLANLQTAIWVGFRQFDRLSWSCAS